MSKRRRTERRMEKAQRRARNDKLVLLEGGERCRRCQFQMQRCGHGPAWRPKPDQPYYFRYWDRCMRCNHLQHYEDAKVLLRRPDTPVDGFDMDRWGMV